MTVRNIITRVQQLRREAAPDADLVQWISDAEQRNVREVIAPRGEEHAFTGYTTGDMQKETLAPAPYDGMYVWYCCMMIDLKENAQDNAGTARGLYEELFERFAKYWIRAHAPAQTKAGSAWFGI